MPAVRYPPMFMHWKLFLLRRQDTQQAIQHGKLAAALLLCSLFFAPNTLTANELRHVSLKVAVDTNVLNRNRYLNQTDLCTFLADENRKLDRASVELLLICKALQLQNIYANLTLIETPNYWRSVSMMRSGTVHVMAESVWSTDVDERYFYISEPVLRAGEFEKGLYTLPQHKLQQQHTRDDIKNYVGVTLKAWYHDWRILNEISPKTLSTIRYTSILKMLDMGRGDYTLLEFPNDDDLIMHIDGIELHPLLGVKVIIPDSRRIAVSRQAPDAEIIGKAINLGIKQMREQGLILPLYKKHGLVNSKTKDWQVLNRLPENISTQRD